MGRMFTWTPDNTETLVRMRAEGHSAAEIARTVGTTRHAVLGKAWRMGLANPVRAKENMSLVCKAAAKALKPRIPKAPKPKPEKPIIVRREPPHPPTYRPKEVRVVDESLMRPWIERQFGQCAFPIVRGETTFSCCADTAGHRAYCPEHQRVMYQALKPMKPKDIHLKTNGRYLP